MIQVNLISDFNGLYWYVGFGKHKKNNMLFQKQPIKKNQRLASIRTSEFYNYSNNVQR